MSGERSFGLDFMRASAVAMVLAAHGASLAWPVFSPGRETILLAYWGVELFFALSGFLIGRILILHADQGSRYVPEFWLRRWLRTLPNYYLFLGLNIAFVLATTGESPPWPAYTVFVQNLLWPHPPFFGEAWSLALEEIFYLAAPIVAVLLSPLLKQRTAVMFAFLIGLGAIVAFRLGTVLTIDPDWDEGVRKVSLIRLDAIAWGVFAAWITLRWPMTARARGLFAVAGLLLIVTMGVRFMTSELNEGWFNRSGLFALTSIGFALLMPWSDRWRGSLFPAAVKRPIVRLAIWSYALYLTHLLVVRVLLHLQFPRNDTWQVAAAYLVYFGVSLAVAALVYRWFERPILDSRDSVVGALLRRRPNQRP